MSKSTATILDKAADLVQSHQGSEALALLDEINAQQLDQAEVGRFCLLVSEAAIIAGQHERVRLEEALQAFSSEPDSANYARTKFLMGRFLSESGRYTEARAAFWEAHLIYLRLDEPLGSATVLNNLAHCEYRSGNLIAAQDHLHECSLMLEKAGKIVQSEMVTKNLALVYAETGKLEQSMKLLWKSFNSPRAGEHTEHDVMAFHLNWAYLKALKGDFKDARKSLACCQPLMEKFQREKGMYYAKVGLTEMLAGQIDQAREALQLAHEVACEVAPGSSLEAEALRLLGEVHSLAGNFDKAEEYGQATIVLAEKISEKVEVACGNRLIAQVELSRGNKAQARACFDKALDLLAMIGSQYRLAVTRYLAASSGLYASAKSKMLMQNARNYFEDEGVDHYLQRLDQSPLAAGSGRSRSGRASKSGVTFVTCSKPMRRIISTARTAAKSECTVLLTGDTGTGKDLMARLVHEHSGRTGEFVSVNTAAIPGTMIESELFGYRKGAFTGADRDRPGLFEQAEGGTLFLNEIADSSPELQAKLLEVLETRQIRHLGENKTRPVNVRLVAATNLNLQAQIDDGKFRRDLFHRLNELMIVLPPLKERQEDIPILVEHFYREVSARATKSGQSQKLEQLGLLLSLDAYPGNVRELRARVNQLYVLSEGSLEGMISEVLKSRPEAALLSGVLILTGWNRSQAARILGVDEATVRRRIKKHDLQPGTNSD